MCSAPERAAGSSVLAAERTLMRTPGCGRMNSCEGVCLGSMAVERMVAFGWAAPLSPLNVRGGRLHQHAGGVVADE